MKTKRKQLLTSDDAIEIKKQHTKPCSDCPFARTALPGWLAGLSVGRWLMMAHSNCTMECHTRLIGGEPAQCAGAAIFRSNVCKWVPKSALDLPADKIKVFSWDDEFASHHEGRTISKEEAANLKFAELFK